MNSSKTRDGVLYVTGVSRVFHRDVDSVVVTDEDKRRQAAVDVHFTGDDVDW